MEKQTTDGWRGFFRQNKKSANVASLLKNTFDQRESLDSLQNEMQQINSARRRGEPSPVFFQAKLDRVCCVTK